MVRTLQHIVTFILVALLYFIIKHPKTAMEEAPHHSDDDGQLSDGASVFSDQVMSVFSDQTIDSADQPDEPVESGSEMMVQFGGEGDNEALANNEVVSEINSDGDSDEQLQTIVAPLPIKLRVSTTDLTIQVSSDLHTEF